MDSVKSSSKKSTESTESTESTPETSITTKSSDVSTGHKFKSKKEFINTIYPSAKREADKLGIPVEVILAQAALESGFGGAVGKSTLTEKANNIFSITKGSWNGDTYQHKDRDVTGQVSPVIFRKYASLDESIADWSALMQRAYKPSLEAARKSVDEFNRVHANSKYATGVGVGNTPEERTRDANEKLYKNYTSVYNEVIKILNS